MQTDSDTTKVGSSSRRGPFHGPRREIWAPGANISARAIVLVTTPRRGRLQGRPVGPCRATSFDRGSSRSTPRAPSTSSGSRRGRGSSASAGASSSSRPRISGAARRTCSSWTPRARRRTTRGSRRTSRPCPRRASRAPAAGRPRRSCGRSGCTTASDKSARCRRARTRSDPPRPGRRSRTSNPPRARPTPVRARIRTTTTRARSRRLCRRRRREGTTDGARDPPRRERREG